MFDRNRVIEQLTALVYSYSELFKLVILFGSVARNDMHEGSDVDIYIEAVDKYTTGKLEKNKRFDRFYNDVLNLFNNNCDLLYYGGSDITRVKKTPLYKQIQTDGVVIYETNQGKQTIS